MPAEPVGATFLPLSLAGVPNGCMVPHQDVAFLAAFLVGLAFS
ncbi:MAG: hypothetical protein ACI8UD_003668 [Planctomycetota bacterium]|jgi:hypothetical protein